MSRLTGTNACAPFSALTSGFHFALMGAAVLMLCLLAGCSAPGKPPHGQTSPRPSPSSSSAPALLSPEQARDVTVYAIGLVGTPYKWGGNTPESGFDCSGLIAHVYQKSAQLKSPRTVAELKDWGMPMTAEALRAGDLIVFSKGRESTHAGIYVGEGRFVHAPSTGGRVRLDRFNSPHWASYTISFQRP
jgi:cell wall-associated NlpC family hydrolase